jgi:DNA polymerase zeta
VDAHIQRLQMSIDHAMAVAYRRNPHDPNNNTYVARITLCKGVPIYGFHVGWNFYLKIYMLNPAYMNRLADLLRNKSIMGRAIQPYEVHIPYLLQFMADFGLYGCGWVDCQNVSFRAPVPATGGAQSWNESTIPERLISSSSDRPRLSHCAIEIDIRSHDIMNRQTIKPRILHHDFVERSHPIPLSEKLVHSMAELWQDEQKRRARRGDSISIPALYTSESRRPAEKEPARWIHENELRLKLEEEIRIERTKSDGHALNFDSFVNRTSFESLVQTALESVTDMFPSELPSSSQKKEEYVGIHATSGHLRERSGEFPSADVDEGRIAALLDDAEANLNSPWNDSASLKDEGDFSEEGEDSPSEIDFDADLLGRGQEKSMVQQDGYGSLGSPDYSPISASIGIDIPDFSDDFDVDFDLSNPNKKLAFVVPSSGNSPGKSIPQTPIVQNDRAKVDEVKSLRLRGGASSPESNGTTRKRKKNEPASTLRKRPKARRAYVSAETEPGVGAPPPHERSGVGGDVASIKGSAEFVRARRFHAKPQFGITILSSVTTRLIWNVSPPSTATILSLLDELGIPRVVSRSAYYSKTEDVPSFIREYAGREFTLVSDSLPYLDSFDSGSSLAGSIFRTEPRPISELTPAIKIWQFERHCPSYARNHAAPCSNLPSFQLGTYPPV